MHSSLNATRPLLATAAAILALWGVLPVRSSAQAGASGCLAADTVRVPPRLAYLKDLVSSTDTERVSMRQTLGIQSVNASKVALVTKQATCQAAVTALNPQRGEPNVQRQVWLYTWGVGYAVDDPGLDVSGRDPALYLFDKNFVYQSTVLGF